jgi:hypothetical protein
VFVQSRFASGGMLGPPYGERSRKIIRALLRSVGG